jgi:lysylphosphatidylglycerol synthetase-like protein (DUF2156 family)
MDRQISEYIKKWGGAASISLLDPKCEIFMYPNIQGALGYHDVDNTAVIFGDPVCAPEDKALLALAFHDFANKSNKGFIYIAASEQFSNWAMTNVCKTLIEVNEELVIDPRNYPKTGSNGRLLHKKVNQASRAGVAIKEFVNDDAGIKEKLFEVEDKWLKGRKGPQMYLSHIDFFEDNCGRRCFYAECNNNVVGTIFLNRLEAHDGWLLYLLMTTSDAPKGTSEHLVLSVLEKLAVEGSHYFSFGISIIEKMGEVEGLNAFFSLLARVSFKITKMIFPLDNRRNFWKKFEPRNKKSFTLFSSPSIGFKDIHAIMKTVNASLTK